MSFQAADARAEPVWFGQPRGLTVLFLTEMWEKFSFYGMRALLVYYMTKQLMVGQAKASLVYGLYTGFVYFTPIFGGLIADRWLGRRRAVIIGGSIMAAGHFAMTFPGLLYPALALIALGNGLFLPSLPSQIGGLYAADDPRRGSAYNIYYVGINLGAVFAPLVCGTLGELYGWHWGFGAAGVGMLLGLCIYILGGRYLPAQRNMAEERAAAAHESVGERRMDRRALWLLAGVWLAAVVFRGAYEQIGNTVALWADAGVDRSLGAVSIPMTWVQSLNPLLVFLLTPPLVAWWTRRATLGREPSALSKMSLGAAILALAYLLLTAVCLMTPAGARASWLWLALFVAILTVGELHILPIGLGVFGRSAPAGLAATAIAAWFFAAFAGNLLAGGLGSLWSLISHAGFFALMAGVAGGATLILVGLNSLSRGVSLGEAAPVQHRRGD